MSKPFKKLLGNRVLLKTPALPESNLKVPTAAQEELKKAYLEKLDRLEVYAVGTTVTDFQEGDFVTVPVPTILSAQKVKISEGVEVCIVSLFDVSIVW